MASPFDGHSNLAATTVATAPSTPTAGTSLVVASGTGALFTGAAPYNCIACPAGLQPTAANAEIVRVTARSTDTFTIVRGPQAGDPGGITRSIIVGDQFFQVMSAKVFTDLEALVPLVGTFFTPGNVGNASATAPVANTIYFGYVMVDRPATLTGIRYTVGASSGNVLASLFNSSGTKVAASNSTAMTASLTNQAVPFTSTYSVNPGLYLTALQFSSASASVLMAISQTASGSATESSFAVPASITPPAISAVADIPVMTTY